MTDLEDTIGRISALGARKPLPSPGRRVLLWLGGVFTYLFVLSIPYGFRHDIAQKIDNPYFLIELVLLLLTAGSAAMAAGWLALPDVGGRPNVRFLPFVFFVPLLAFVGYEQWMPALTGQNLVEAINHENWPCVLHLALVSVPPGMSLFLLIVRGATTRPVWAGSMASLSVATFGYFVLRLVEPTDDALHLLIWHALPLAVFCALGVGLGRRTLQW